MEDHKKNVEFIGILGRFAPQKYILAMTRYRRGNNQILTALKKGAKYAFSIVG